MSGRTFDAIVRWNGRVTMWLARIAAVFLAIVAVMTFCDVIARYVFLKPFSFTVEVTEFCMALIVFLAVGLVTHDDAHINVDVVTLRLPYKARVVLSLIVNILAFAFLVIMVWRLWLQAFFLLSKGDRTQIWGMPYGPLAIVMAIGSLLLLTGTLIYVIRSIRSLRGQEAPQVSSVAKPFTD